MKAVIRSAEEIGVILPHPDIADTSINYWRSYKQFNSHPISVHLHTAYKRRNLETYVSFLVYKQSNKFNSILSQLSQRSPCTCWYKPRLVQLFSFVLNFELGTRSVEILFHVHNFIVSFCPFE